MTTGSFITSCAVLTVITAVLNFIATVLHAVAFGTRVWLESDGTSPFDKIGFHEACFVECRHPYCPNGDPDYVYDGCWWLYNYYFKEIWWWLMPDWFIAIRNMTIVNVPVITSCCILTVVTAILAVTGHNATTQNRGRDILLLVLLYLGSTILFISGVMGISICSRFSYHAFRKDWMPMPEKNHLGYSFYLEVVSTGCLIVGFMTCLLAAIFKTLRFQNVKDPHFSEDMMLGRRW